MRTKTKIITLVATTAVVLAIGVIATAQNLTVQGTATVNGTATVSGTAYLNAGRIQDDNYWSFVATKPMYIQDTGLPMYVYQRTIYLGNRWAEPSTQQIHLSGWIDAGDVPPSADDPVYINDDLTVAGSLGIRGTQYLGGTGTYDWKRVYGLFGSSNHVNGDSLNKWIKFGSFTIPAAAWAGANIKIRFGRTNAAEPDKEQVVNINMRTHASDIEGSYDISLMDTSPGALGSVKDVKLVRTAGTGLGPNTLAIWLQMGASWMSSTPVDVEYNAAGAVTFAFNLTAQPQNTSITDVGTQYGLTASVLGMNSAGDIGVGTASPGGKLEVAGGSSTLRLKKTAGAAGSVDQFVLVGDATARTGTALCTTTSLGGVATARCLAYWASSADTTSTCATSVANARVLCADWGD